MFTDMVGYTALGQRNESLALALVEEQRKVIRPILGKHNGREIKTIGDAFLVEFPSALDAVRCAYDIQRATRELNVSLPEDRRVHLRIGVHLGDVIESGGDISGDAVNVASRIEPLADDGGVAISRQVYDQVQNKLELPLLSVGKRQLKNVSVPVEVFKMVMPWEGARGESTTRLDRGRIAVLPFANMSPDPNDEYFADGLTEELITSLSGVGELTVIARTSIMKYKAMQKGASEIGRELDVGILVEGSVRKAGSRVRITVQVIDAQNEGHLWAQSYDRDLQDIFAIQSDIAKQVVEALQVRLLAVDKKRFDKVPTSSIEAYTLYLKGRFHSSKPTKEAYVASIEYYERAVAIDPDFALAYAALALSYTMLGFFGMLPSEETDAKARKYAEKALRLDDSLAEAHLAMGRILRQYDWNFTGADKEFKQAIKLNPSLAEAFYNIAWLMLFKRRFDEAVAEARRALELDPLYELTSTYAGGVFLLSGRYDEAIEQFTKALKIEPDNTYARLNLGLAHVQKGMFDVGIQEMQKAASINSPTSQIDLAYAYAKAGRTENLKNLLNELLERAERNPELDLAVASAFGNLGDRDNAFAWLEKAFKEHLAYFTLLPYLFAFDSIRSDPRFQALMERVGPTIKQ